MRLKLHQATKKGTYLSSVDAVKEGVQRAFLSWIVAYKKTLVLVSTTTNEIH